MKVTVAICTRNRATHLGAMFHSVSGLIQPKGLDWELLLIDNGSSDNTAQVVQSFARDLPIRYVFEPVAGLSNARNRAVKEARGDYIIWTDDDVELDPSWLAAYVEAFKANPAAAVFGGRILLNLALPTPHWLTDNLDELGRLLAWRDLGDLPAPLSIEGDRLPYGANFAIRTVEQRMFLFDPGLGVSPDQRRLGEETQVIRAILSSGYTGVWVPRASVLHAIPVHRQTEDYLLSYQRAAGETWAYLADTNPDSFFGGPTHKDRGVFLNAPLWVWKQALTNRLKYFVLRPFARSEVWLKPLMDYGYYRGALEFWTRRPVRTV